MDILPRSTQSRQAWLPALLAVSTVAACTTGTGFTAGAPSTHAAQTYEATTSTAASSTLGGAVIRSSFDFATGASARGLATVTGSLTHNTGRLELNNGLYLFVDPDGPDVNDLIAPVGAATGGTVGLRITGTYQYVIPYELSYSVGGVSYSTEGVAGIITAPTDMPSAGSARYTGEAYMNMSPAALVGTYYDFENGTSTVAVDFAAGTANVTLGSFTIDDKPSHSRRRAV